VAGTSANQIGVALKGRRSSNGWLVRCPCPNHGKGRGDRYPSLSIADGDDGRLLATCFAGCKFEEIIDELKRRGLIVNDNRTTEPYRPARRVVVEPEPEPDPEALKIWRGAAPAPYSVVAEYLERRGIPFHPPLSVRCQRGRPAMIVAVQRPDGKIIAVQQTWLTNDGQKALVSPPRITTGSLDSGAVRLGPAAEVMGVAEGVETALSAMQLTGMPVWASLGSKRLHKVWLPPHVGEVHIFGDNDTSGRDAAKLTYDAQTRAGRVVVERFPPDSCNDYNDLLNLIADGDGRDLLPEDMAHE
jgi:putative DNA primase/helicase